MPSPAIGNISARQIRCRITDKILQDLQQMSDTLLSGEESGLANIWEEICVQIRGEHSVVWDVYDFTVRTLVASYVEELSDCEREAIWRQTENGMEWEFDKDPAGEPAPVNEADLVNDLAESVYFRADGFSNTTIEAFLRPATDDADK